MEKDKDSDHLCSQNEHKITTFYRLQIKKIPKDNIMLTFIVPCLSNVSFLSIGGAWYQEPAGEKLFEVEEKIPSLVTRHATGSGATGKAVCIIKIST